MSVIQTIAARLQNAEAIVSAARQTGVELAIACALIEKESGGRNVYGGDVGGTFSQTPRKAVTPANFAQFYDLVVNKGRKSNGVGPAQITYRAYFPDARAKGIDLADPTQNIAYGLRILAGHLRSHTIAEAGTLYNAGNLHGGINAYGRDLAAKTTAWRERLAGTDHPKESPAMSKIYVSPSTQINNAYAGGGNERDNMRAVRDHLVPMLEAAGHSVRTGNWTNDIASPVADANRWGADYYVAPHTNASGRPGLNARGVSMHVYGFGGTAEKLARALAAEAAKLSPSRTSVRKDKFYEVRKTKMPAVLSENDFHDNRAGADWIRNNHRTIAIWHARALCRLAGGSDQLERYLSGSSAPAPKPSTPKPPAPKPLAPAPTPGTRLVKIDTDVLNVRSGPGTNYRVTTTVKRGQVFTIVSTQGSWGKLKSGAGWIHLGHTKPHGSAPAPAPKPKADTVQITASALNVRSGPGTGNRVTTRVKRGEVYTIVERKNGWGRLKSGAGWISLAYTKNA